MRNLIPAFINDMNKANKYNEKFTATTMFMDISGFTLITEKLMREGKEGAEILSSILNNFFEPIIDSVYKRGGYISGFAGDAFFAIFPDPIEPIEALYSSNDIIRIFKENEIQKTRFGEFILQIKIGLSYGEVEWGIPGPKNKKSYYFKGNTINECSNCEKHCESMQIVIDDYLGAKHHFTDKKEAELKQLELTLTNYLQSLGINDDLSDIVEYLINNHGKMLEFFNDIAKLKLSSTDIKSTIFCSLCKKKLEWDGNTFVTPCVCIQKKIEKLE